jgi:hypothetical protein
MSPVCFVTEVLSTLTLTSAPTLQGVAPFNNGVLAQYKAITNSNSVELATSYTLQWSTTNTFTTIAGSQTFPATGSGGANIWLLNTANTTTCTNCSTLASGSYYFRTYGTSAGTATSPYSSVAGPITMGAPSGGVAVSGAVTYTGTATGPMYVGFYNYSTNAFYGEYIASPSSAAAYTVPDVPIASTYYFVSVVDNNKDGVIDAGDFTDVSGKNPPTVDIAAATTNEDLTLSGAGSSAAVTTQVSSSPGNSNSYSLQFQVSGLVKLPVAVTLTSSTNADGANVAAPTDIAVCSGGNNSCGQGFQIDFNLNTTSPTVGDTYTFGITYSDGTPGTATATVTAVLNAFATLVSPTGTSSSLQPTFTWTDPSNASNYTYQFQLSPQNSNTIWQIPGNNSNSNGMTSSTTSITWGVDPTGGGSTPSVGSLTSGTTYVWQIQVQDSNGNSTQTQTTFVAP